MAEPTAPSQIGRNLQIARENAGLDQEAAAPQLGVHPQTLSKYERGAIQKVSVAVLERAAAAYGESLERLTKAVIKRGEQLSEMVPRGTSGLRDAHPGLSAAAAKRIRDFEREAARLGATDQELDHIGESLTSGSSRSFYMGGREEEELDHLIAGLRAWLDRRIADRKATERRKR